MSGLVDEFRENIKSKLDTLPYQKEKLNIQKESQASPDFELQNKTPSPKLSLTNKISSQSPVSKPFSLKAPVNSRFKFKLPQKTFLNPYENKARSDLLNDFDQSRCISPDLFGNLDQNSDIKKKSPMPKAHNPNHFSNSDFQSMDFSGKSTQFGCDVTPTQNVEKFESPVAATKCRTNTTEISKPKQPNFEETYNPSPRSLASSTSIANDFDMEEHEFNGDAPNDGTDEYLKRRDFSFSGNFIIMIFGVLFMTVFQLLRSLKDFSFSSKSIIITFLISNYWNKLVK